MDPDADPSVSPGINNADVAMSDGGRVQTTGINGPSAVRDDSAHNAMDIEADAMPSPVEMDPLLAPPPSTVPHKRQRPLHLHNLDRQPLDSRPLKYRKVKSETLPMIFADPVPIAPEMFAWAIGMFRQSIGPSTSGPSDVNQGQIPMVTEPSNGPEPSATEAMTSAQAQDPPTTMNANAANINDPLGHRQTMDAFVPHQHPAASDSNLSRPVETSDRDVQSSSASTSLEHPMDTDVPPQHPAASDFNLSGPIKASDYDLRSSNASTSVERPMDASVPPQHPDAPDCNSSGPVETSHCDVPFSNAPSFVTVDPASVHKFTEDCAPLAEAPTSIITSAQDSLQPINSGPEAPSSGDSIDATPAEAQTSVITSAEDFLQPVNSGSEAPSNGDGIDTPPAEAPSFIITNAQDSLQPINSGPEAPSSGDSIDATPAEAQTSVITSAEDFLQPVNSGSEAPSNGDGIDTPPAEAPSSIMTNAQDSLQSVNSGSEAPPSIESGVALPPASHAASNPNPPVSEPVQDIFAFRNLKGPRTFEDAAKSTKDFASPVPPQNIPVANVAPSNEQTPQTDPEQAFVEGSKGQMTVGGYILRKTTARTVAAGKASLVTQKKKAVRGKKEKAQQSKAGLVKCFSAPEVRRIRIPGGMALPADGAFDFSCPMDVDGGTTESQHNAPAANAPVPSNESNAATGVAKEPIVPSADKPPIVPASASVNTTSLAGISPAISTATRPGPSARDDGLRSTGASNQLPQPPSESDTSTRTRTDVPLRGHQPAVVPHAPPPAVSPSPSLIVPTTAATPLPTVQSASRSQPPRTRSILEDPANATHDNGAKSNAVDPSPGLQSVDQHLSAQIMHEGVDIQGGGVDSPDTEDSLPFMMVDEPEPVMSSAPGVASSSKKKGKGKGKGNHKGKGKEKQIQAQQQSQPRARKSVTIEEVEDEDEPMWFRQRSGANMYGFDDSGANQDIPIRDNRKHKEKQTQAQQQSQSRARKSVTIEEVEDEDEPGFRERSDADMYEFDDSSAGQDMPIQSGNPVQPNVQLPEPEQLATKSDIARLDLQFNKFNSMVELLFLRQDNLLHNQPQPAPDPHTPVQPPRAGPSSQRHYEYLHGHDDMLRPGHSHQDEEEEARCYQPRTRSQTRKSTTLHGFLEPSPVPKTRSQAENTFNKHIRDLTTTLLKNREGFPVPLATREEVLAYEETSEPDDGPSLEHFRCDVYGKTLNTPWNMRLAEIFLAEWIASDEFPPAEGHAVEAAFLRHLSYRVGLQEEASAKSGSPSNNVDTPRRSKRSPEDSKAANRRSKRTTALHSRRMDSAYYHEELLHLVFVLQSLSRKGMSDDESDHDGGTRNGGRLYRIHEPDWRATFLGPILRILDLLYVPTKFRADGSVERGAWPRFRKPCQKVKKGKAIVGLPSNWYNPVWLRKQSPSALKELRMQPPVEVSLSDSVKREAARYLHISTENPKPMDPEDVNLAELEQWLETGETFDSD